MTVCSWFGLSRLPSHKVLHSAAWLPVVLNTLNQHLFGNKFISTEVKLTSCKKIYLHTSTDFWHWQTTFDFYFWIFKIKFFGFLNFILWSGLINFKSWLHRNCSTYDLMFLKSPTRWHQQLLYNYKQMSGYSTVSLVHVFALTQF